MPKRTRSPDDHLDHPGAGRSGSAAEPVTMATRTRSSRRQPPNTASRASAQPQAGQSAVVAEADDGEVSASARKERKRLTDRVAQREHRKRQKQYIEELEAQLSMLKEGGQSEVTQLAARNLQLYDELKQMHALWDEMEQLLQRQRQLRQNSAVAFATRSGVQTSQSVARERAQQPIDDQAPTGHLSHHTGSQEGSQSPYPDALPDAEAVPNDAEITRTGEGPDQAMSVVPQHDMFIMHDDHDQSRDHDHDRPAHGQSHDPASHLATGSSAQNQPSLLSSADAGMEFALATMPQDSWQRTHQQHIPSQTRPFEPTWESWTRPQDDNSGAQPGQRTFRARPYPSNGSFQREVMPYHNQTMPASENMSILELLESYVGQCVSPLSLCFPNPSDGPRHHQALPLVTSPNMPQDVKVQAIIERARANMDSIGPPKLTDFLFDDPRNTLSLDLKMFLDPLRKWRRTSEYLAAYWVLYLLFRWQAVQTEEAFQSLPPWLRPTPLQLNVLHPHAADLVAWPEVREEFIRISHNSPDEIHEISATIGQFLTVDIETSDPELLNNPQRLEAEITNLANWKLGAGFYDKHPQLRSWKIPRTTTSRGLPT